MGQTLKIIGIAMAAFAVYLPAAFLVGRNYTPKPTPDGAAMEMLLVITPVHRHAYRAQTYTLASYADSDLNNQRSPVIVYEDMTPLGPGRAQRAEVEDLGRGRFYHSTVAGAPESWRYVVFSTSDNSDPRTNGRIYWAVVPR
jgi:hypothetical protein